MKNEPAFPCPTKDWPQHKGMSKRFYTACHLLQGILANKGAWDDWALKEAFDGADALIKYEEQHPMKP